MSIVLPLGVYIHVPWCVRKCPYCDFNSHALEGTRIDESTYLDALIMDLDQEPLSARKRWVSTIFIGGGTPSLFSPTVTARLLASLHTRLAIITNAEATLEANPGTVDTRRLMDFRAAGINRLSLGIQSFNDGSLACLGRIHDRREAFAAFDAARRAGFDNINLDVMFGLPGQSLEDAQADLAIACALEPEHISYYQLTIEPQTAFHHHPPSLLPDEDLLWAMQEQGMELLAENNYLQYEVSAYARPGRCCRHNLNYWEFGDYLGIGAGAHGKITDSTGIHRRWKLSDPQNYLAGIKACSSIRNQYLAGDELVTNSDLPVEFLLNALRLVSGVPTQFYTQRTGLPLVGILDKLTTARVQGWLENREDRLVPTTRGRRFLNELLELFLPDGNTVLSDLPKSTNM
ncbi:Heme chaperone HemW [Gammaproteobacteria bacterium]